MPNPLKGIRDKISRFLHSEVEVKLLYLNKKGKPVEKLGNPYALMNGRVLDEFPDPRKVLSIGGSFYVPIREGWKDVVADKDDNVKCCLVQVKQEEYVMIVSKPMGEK